MHRRLIVGCGPTMVEAVVQIAELPGETVIISRRRELAERCAGLDVRCLRRDPHETDEYPPKVDAVVCAGGQTDRNAELVTAVRRRYAATPLIVIGGEDDASAAAASIATAADRWVTNGSAIAGALEGILGVSQPTRAASLMRVLHSVQRPLAVLMHATPDPDAIASALGLIQLAERAGLPAAAYHFGEVSHQENRALVNLLGVELNAITDLDELEQDAAIALVDHTRVPPRLADDVVVVIDHHSVREPITAPYIHIDPEVGATSTIIVQYLRELMMTPDSDLASALTVGIRTDTGDFTREVDSRDLNAASWLSRWHDEDLLERLETPTMNAGMLDVLARAAVHREVVDSVLLAPVGEVQERDALAQTADHLLQLAGVDVVVVYGYTDAAVLVSARAQGSIDVGHLLASALGQIGSAGGHEDMAGAQVRWGIMEDGIERDADDRWEIAEKIVAGRITETLDDARRVQMGQPGDLTFEGAPGE